MGVASLHHYLLDRPLLIGGIVVATLLVALLLIAFAATPSVGIHGDFVADSSSETSPFRWR